MSNTHPHSGMSLHVAAFCHFFSELQECDGVAVVCFAAFCELLLEELGVWSCSYQKICQLSLACSDPAKGNLVQF